MLKWLRLLYLFHIALDWNGTYDTILFWKFDMSKNGENIVFQAKIVNLQSINTRAIVSELMGKSSKIV